MRRLPIALLIAALGSTTAQAGLLDDDEARRQIADLQIKTEARFDQQGKAQLELASQIQRQADEIARLRGQIETLSYELETARKRQQDFYLDLDTRLRKFEPQVVAEGDPGAAPAASATADAGAVTAEYDAALNRFKAGKYKDAATAFAVFVQAHPDSALAPNAQFWLGNAWYAQGNCVKAVEAQNVVVSKYATSDKAPEALLAMATCRQELGNLKGARSTLETLVAKYPNAPAAETARERLKKK